MKHWPISIVFGTQNCENDYSFGQFTLMLSLHYLVKCKSRSLAIYSNELTLDSACIGSEND